MAVSLQQMLSVPSVRGVFNRTAAAGQFFQAFFRMRPTDVAGQLNFGDKRTGFYDLWRHSLVMSQLRAPKTGPNRIPFKTIGQAQTTVARIYESCPYDYGDIFGGRGLGTMELDARGQGIIARQNQYMAARVSNTVEFMISRMFRGAGFSITQSDESFRLGETGAGNVDIAFNVPAGNIDTIGTISGVAGAWTSSATKVKDQLLQLNAVAERTTGLAVRHLIMNSVTYSALEGISQLASLRGTALPVFSDFQQSLLQTAGGATRNSGFTTIFPAMPQYMIHVYDGVSHVGVDVDPSSRTTGNTTKYIPDYRVIACPDPDPGGWHGTATCEEPIRKDKNSKGYEMVSGLDSWTWPIDEPPGEDLRVLLNYIPVLYNPDCLFYLTVNS